MRLSPMERHTGRRQHSGAKGGSFSKTGEGERKPRPNPFSTHDLFFVAVGVGGERALLLMGGTPPRDEAPMTGKRAR